jgi:predicted RNA binding protein YcfA (HicA-like mRNA interferase family)
MKFSQLKALLQENGCYLLRQGSNHELWYSPITKRKFTVARHGGKEVATATAKAIIKQSGVK